MRILEKKHTRYSCAEVFAKFDDAQKREIRDEICKALYLSSLPPLYAVVSGRRPVLLWEAKVIEEIFARRGVKDVWKKIKT